MVNVIIVAGGIGTRMNSETPKQFLLLHEKPIIYYSIRQFIETFPSSRIIVVLPSHFIEHGKILLQPYFDIEKIQFVEGGETRFHSVKNGLDTIDNEGIVFIHDAVRPCINDLFLKNLFQQANDIGHAIPCIDIKDSIREVNSDNNKAIDRSKLKAIQTPQTFKIPLIKHAFSQPYKDSFTDEASVLESIGVRIYLVDGLEKNIKITKPLDLEIASLFLKE